MLPGYLAAYGWIPFVVILLVIFIFSIAFVRYYGCRVESEISSSLIAVISLTLTLTTSALLPVDVFLASWMKTTNGTFQDWAQNATDRQNVEDGVMYTYYALYGAIIVLAGFFLPFAYFYHEELDDDRPWRNRACRAFKYTIGFTILTALIILTGAFIPLNENTSLNGTAWDQFEELIHSFEKNGGEDAISFVVSIICLIGLLFNVFYTGYGMGVWPIQLLKGSRSVRRDYEEIRTRRAQLRRERETAGSGLYPHLRERNIAESERLLAHHEEELEGAAHSRVRLVIGWVWRPFEIILGVVFLLLAALVFISLLLTNIDKAMHAYMRTGYLLPSSNRTLVNPIDWVLVKSQEVFPIDFILFAVVVIFLTLATVMAVRAAGVRCFCLKLFNVKPHGTRPQGILLLCFILIFAVLGLNVVMYFLSPQYSTFGSEHYIADLEKNLQQFSSVANGTSILRPCDESAIGQCVMTRNSFFLVRYFFKAWFFGACYYWFSWGILATYLYGLLYALVQKNRTVMDDVRDDLDELE